MDTNEKNLGKALEDEDLEGTTGGIDLEFSKHKGTKGLNGQTKDLNGLTKGIDTSDNKHKHF